MGKRTAVTVCVLLSIAVPHVFGVGSVTYNVTIQGEFGKSCTSKGRYCISGATCKGSKCECPAGMTGDAEIHCVDQDHHLCTFTGENTANVKGFGGAKEAIDLPCSYRASRFVLRLADEMSFCAVEVHVTNELLRDNYVTRNVHVSVGLTEPIKQLQSVTDVLVTGAFNEEDGSYNYVIRQSPLEVFAWGSAVAPSGRREGEIINATVDRNDNLVEVLLPLCGTSLKYRVYASGKSAQTLLPGVSLSVPKGADFVSGMGDYPASLCGRDADVTSLFKSRSDDLGLDSPSLALVRDVLAERAPQFDNPLGEQCQIAMDLLTSSNNQADHLKACHFILDKKRLRTCLRNKNLLAPIELFNACMKFQQSRDLSSCHVMQDAANQCGSANWKGEKTYDCQ